MTEVLYATGTQKVHLDGNSIPQGTREVQAVDASTHFNYLISKEIPFFFFFFYFYFFFKENSVEFNGLLI